jgi:hypothetical protein
MDEMAAGTGPNGSNRLTRRDALKRGAVVAGVAGVAFVIPVVETISIKPAAAQGTSGGHNYGGGDDQGTNGQDPKGGGNSQ